MNKFINYLKSDNSKIGIIILILIGGLSILLNLNFFLNAIK